MRYQGPDGAPGRETRESRENLPEAPLGPRHASLCTEDGHKFRLLAGRRKRDRDRDEEGRTDRPNNERSKSQVGVQMQWI